MCSIVCLPPSFITQVLLACHDNVTAGHLGVTRTLSKVYRRFSWPKMSQQVSQYVRSCQDCQTKKGLRSRPAGLLSPIRSSEPFERIGIDLIGPFPLSRGGNRHVVIAVDYFTKWVIAKAVPSKETIHIVDFFVRRLVLQHGAPVYVISDRGASFKADFAEKLFKALQSNHLLTTAYHPQCNALWKGLTIHLPRCYPCLSTLSILIGMMSSTMLYLLIIRVDMNLQV